MPPLRLDDVRRPQPQHLTVPRDCFPQIFHKASDERDDGDTTDGLKAPLQTTLGGLVSGQPG